MKFICTKENLLLGLSRVTPLAGRNTQLPILQNVLLQLREGVLHLVCTDLEIGIHAQVPGKIEAEGACTIIARRFLEYIQHLPGTDPLELQLKKNTIHVSTVGFQAEFPSTPDDDFPLLPTGAHPREIKLRAEVLCEGLKRTLFAAAREATRPEIHSVFISAQGDQLRMAATDSFRLAEEVITLDEEQEPFSLLLPLSTAQEIVRLFSDQKTITILPQENHVVCQGDGVEISSRLVDGKYPDYQQIIPTNFKIMGEVDREALLRALKTLTVFLPRDSRRVQLKVRPSSGRLELAVGGSDSGAGRVELDFTGEGEELEVLFNIQYLLDGVQYIPSKKCTLKFVGSTDPAMLKPIGEAAGYTYVVMPIQA